MNLLVQLKFTVNTCGRLYFGMVRCMHIVYILNLITSFYNNCPDKVHLQFIYFLIRNLLAQNVSVYTCFGMLR